MPTTQFGVRVVGSASVHPDEWETLAGTLRTELLDMGATRVEAAPAGDAPPDARGVVADVSGVLDLIVTAGQAVDVLKAIIRGIQHWMATRSERSRPVTLEIAGVELGTDEASVDAVVDRLTALAPGSATAGVRRALVIANLSYDDPALRGLRAPADDARALDRVLRDPRIGGFDVDLCVDETEPVIRRRIADFFADRDRDDLLLLHYSGHGLKDQRGRLYLAARDTDLRRLSATGVSASFVNDQMTESASRRVVLILDCCYSGAFARGTLARADRSVHVAEEFGGAGRVVLTASSATEYAFEGGEITESEGQPSVFTSALVRGLETGAADLDTDGEITIDELYDYTYREVRRDQPGQAPMKWTFGVEGALVLARSVRGAGLPVSVVDDLASNRIGLRLEAVEELAHLIAAGRPAIRDAARRALVRLTEEDDSVRVRSAALGVLDGTGASTGSAAGVAIPVPRVPVAPPADVVSTRPAPTRPAPTGRTPTATTPVVPGRVLQPDFSRLPAIAALVAGVVSAYIGIVFLNNEFSATNVVIAGVQLMVYAAYRFSTSISRPGPVVAVQGPLLVIAFIALAGGIAVSSPGSSSDDYVLEATYGGLWAFIGIAEIVAALASRRGSQTVLRMELAIGALAALAGAGIGINAGRPDTPRNHDKLIGIVAWMVVLGVALIAVGVVRWRAYRRETTGSRPPTYP